MDGETILGHRARIGYTVAAVTTEIYPIDWYRIAADGVSLMMITLPLGNRSPEDVEKCSFRTLKRRRLRLNSRL